tara:strand:- start:1742 stop:2068 length:327 start_codon:yes stop_codon:yes gene_type:complete
MAYTHQHIIGSSGFITKIRSIVTDTTTLQELTLSSVKDNGSCTVDLFIYGNHAPVTGQKFYIIKNLIILKGTSVTFDSSDIGYDNKLYDLYIQVSSNKDALDLKLKIT